MHILIDQWQASAGVTGPVRYIDDAVLALAFGTSIVILMVRRQREQEEQRRLVTSMNDRVRNELQSILYADYLGRDKHARDIAQSVESIQHALGEATTKITRENIMRAKSN